MDTALLITAFEDKLSNAARRWIEIRIRDDEPGGQPEYRATLVRPVFTTNLSCVATPLGLRIVRASVTSLRKRATCESEMRKSAPFTRLLPAG